MINSSRPLGAMYNLKVSALDDTQRYSINRTLLHVAIATNNLVHFTALLGSSSLDVNVPDEEMRTPLHTAAFFGRYNMVCDLLARGAACNQRDNKGHTPLHDAVNPVFLELTEEHVHIADLLLNKGARSSMQAASGFTPLNWMGKFIRHADMSVARAGYMFSLANLLISFGAKADEFVYEYDDENSGSSIHISKRGREGDDDLGVIHTPLTWAVSLELDNIIRLFESRLGVDHTVLEDATSNLGQLSLLTDHKRQRPESIVVSPSSPSCMTEDDDLSESVYGAGL